MKNIISLFLVSAIIPAISFAEVRGYKCRATNNTTKAVEDFKIAIGADTNSLLRVQSNKTGNVYPNMQRSVMSLSFSRSGFYTISGDYLGQSFMTFKSDGTQAEMKEKNSVNPKAKEKLECERMSDDEVKYYQHW